MPTPNAIALSQTGAHQGSVDAQNILSDRLRESGSSKTKVFYGIMDTGGGHRAASYAIATQLGSTRFQHDIQDVTSYCSFPVSHFNTLYKQALHYTPHTYGFLYDLANISPNVSKFLNWEPGYEKKLADLLRERNPDLIISVHPLLNTALVKARNAARIKAPVYTDLIDFHEGWIRKEVDHIFVPTKEAYSYTINRGIPKEKIHIVNYPLNPKFTSIASSKIDLRKKLNLPKNKKIILLMSGGEGGGKLSQTTLSLANSKVLAKLGCHFIVVTARNANLKTKLEKSFPKTQMTVMGNCDNIHELMRASDLLVTKAGSGSIYEALQSNRLPIIINDYVPGQELPNTRFVEKNGIGLVALNEKDVVRSTAYLLENPEKLEKIRNNQMKLITRENLISLGESIQRILFPQRGSYCGEPIASPPIAHVRDRKESPSLADSEINFNAVEKTTRKRGSYCGDPIALPPIIHVRGETRPQDPPVQR
jgi:UDP-N-acetylglucosamine:LPS N-acetylglucosamine transferase